MRVISGKELRVAPCELWIFFQMRRQNLLRMESIYQMKTRSNFLIQFLKGSTHTISLTFCLTTKEAEKKTHCHLKEKLTVEQIHSES